MRVYVNPIKKINGQYQAEIRLEFEKMPYEENEKREYDGRSYRLFVKDKEYCAITVDSMLEEWMLISELTDIFYGMLKHSRKYHQPGGRIIRSYMKRCRTEIFSGRILRSMELIFEGDEIGIEERIAMLLHNEMGDIKKLQDLKRELHESNLLNLAKDAMLRLRTEERIKEAVFLGIAYQTPLRTREILQIHKEDIKKGVLIYRAEYGKYTNLPDTYYHISKRLYQFIQLLPIETGPLFTEGLSRYMCITHSVYSGTLHDLRREQIFYNLHVKGG